MAYHVDISRYAQLDTQDAYDWMEQHSPNHIDDWFRGLMDAVFSLDEMPRRCGFAPESANYDKEVRQLLYVKRSVTYRILFVMRPGDEEVEGIIRVIRIRHGAQRLLTLRELNMGEED